MYITIPNNTKKLFTYALLILCTPVLSTARARTYISNRISNTTAAQRLRALKLQRQASDTWALHTIIDLEACDYHAIRSDVRIKRFMHSACAFIGVTPIGGPISVYHQAGYGYTSGYSYTQHANGHTDITLRIDEYSNTICIDVFSCKFYDPYELVEIARSLFDAYDATVDVYFRN